jgi:transposase
MAILDFLRGQRGTLHIAFEEGTYAAWLDDLIRPHVANVVVCDPRRIVTQGNKTDKIDAKRLAELLRTKALTPVYHGEQCFQGYGRTPSDIAIRIAGPFSAAAYFPAR